jgi:hypothetical protein
MTVFIVDPRLTTPDAPDAPAFVDRFRREIERHLPVSVLSAPAAVASASVGAGDVVAIINPASGFEDRYVLGLLERAAQAGATFMPVAMSEHTRRPAGASDRVQSFDVVDELRRRHLDRAQVGILASALARAVVARIQPTLCKERMRLFVSHRRLDGEELASAFWEQARARGSTNGVFRDLSDVRAGRDNDQAIIDALEQSDAVIFLDTPKTGESPWVARELQLALARDLPIVWVRFGPTDGRVPLPITPSGEPHFDFPDADVARATIAAETVDAALHAAFDLSRRWALRVFDTLERLQALARTGAARVRTLDAQHMVYEVQVPRAPARYRERPLLHLVQFFGRWPDAEDEAGFDALVAAAGYAAHPQHGPPFDAAVMAAPVTPNNAVPSAAGGGPGGPVPRHVDAADEYVADLERRLRRGPAESPKRGIILSGAFPDASPDHQQHVKDALYAFARAVYDRGGTVIFGGHPTFEPMLVQIARERRPGASAAHTRLYLSRFFVAPAQLDAHGADATVTATPVVDDDRAKSLTAMRRAMITDPTARALVAIGGREPTPGRSPGVDEEVALARAAGLPVFLVGSAGGRTATLDAERRASGGPPPLNALPEADNDGLFLDTNYGWLANVVLDHLGL